MRPPALASTLQHLRPYASLGYRPHAPELFLPAIAARSARAVYLLTNRGKIPLELIEVQTGSYLGGADIFRLDDIHKGE